jgi:EAL domain-containing protein (putative c-di-GMP-specific phosphodiesterase class I)
MISFELVESIYLDESDDMVAWNIDQIRELGIDIEMDDFGTGYASIVSLLKLRPRRLKIDRQLIMPVVASESQRQLVASIVDIGHSLGIGVVAEGVETLEHAAIAADLGCDILQGYAFAKPLSPTQIERFLAKHQQAAA